MDGAWLASKTVKYNANTSEATATTAAIPETPRSTYGTSVNVYDSQGVATPVNLYFMKNTTANTWDVYTTLDKTVQATGSPVTTLTFDSAGKILTPIAATPDTGFGVRLTNILPTNNPNNTTVPIHSVVTAPDVAGVFLDLSKVTQFGSKFAVSDLQQDGYAAGEMTGVNIGSDGSVVASYSNGTTSTVAQVALANFRNPQGLTPIGDNNWAESIDSGTAVMGKPGDGNFGALRSGALEDSNVDLTAELVNMMTAQRSYQANAQTIKTQDQVISTIVNLR